MRKLSTHELGRKSISEFREATKIPVIVVLDNIRSSYNVGAVFRTADAFLVKQIFLCGITAAPPHREIQKTAIGATETVEWKYFNSIQEAIDSLKEEYTILPVEQTDNSILLDQYEIKKEKRYALIFGNEVNGVSKEVINTCNYSLEIPQEGTKHSLNIAVSAGVILWHFYKSLR